MGKKQRDNTVLPQDDKPLVNAILKDAQAEAEHIIREAEKQRQQKLESAAAAEEHILKEARKTARRQTEALKKAFDSATTVSLRRIKLNSEERIYSYMLDQVKKKINSLIRKQIYKKILAEWIAEAAMGLGTKECLVNASEAEKKLIDEKVLKEAGNIIFKISNRRVHLSVSPETPVSGQGIVLKDSAGRLSFDNRVETRVDRYETKIRKLIYKQFIEE